MKFSDLNTLLKKLLTTFEVICYLYYIVLLLHKVFQFYPNRVSMDLDIFSALFTDIPQCRLVFTSCAIWKNADLRNISALAHPKHYRWFSYECFLLVSFCLDITPLLARIIWREKMIKLIIHPLDYFREISRKNNFIYICNGSSIIIIGLTCSNFKTVLQIGHK